MKEKLGLFNLEPSEAKNELTPDEREFVFSTATQVAERSLTLVQDLNRLLPLDPQSIKRVLMIAVCPWDAEFTELENLESEFQARGMEVVVKRNIWYEELEQIEKEFDLILYALVARSHKPMGPIAFTFNEASTVWSSLTSGIQKSVVVSFSSPYLFSDYFDTAPVYVNAYSNVPATHSAVVKALLGEISFSGTSPVQNV
jgi:beta-N-acetylhexosaminidase